MLQFYDFELIWSRIIENFEEKTAIYCDFFHNKTIFIRVKVEFLQRNS